MSAPSGDNWQDWTTVTFSKRRGDRPTTNEKAVTEARRAGGSVETVKKYNAGTNKHTAGPSNAKKLEDETEELHHETVSRDLALKIQQGRLAKKMTQKDLATAINERQSVINDYEAGRAIPSNQIISKLERALGVKLRGK